MKPKILLRIAAGCLLFFAVGHSIGHFTRHNVTNPKAKEILQLMSENKFDMFGQMRSYDENYTGMSINLLFTLLAFTIILWLCSYYADQQPNFIKKVLIPISTCVLGFSVTSFLYFFSLPALTCLVATVLILLAIAKLRSPSTSV